MDSILILDDSSTSQRERSMPGIHHIKSSLNHTYRKLIRNLTFPKKTLEKMIDASRFNGDCLLFISILLCIFSRHSSLVLSLMKSQVSSETDSANWENFQLHQWIQNHWKVILLYLLIFSARGEIVPKMGGSGGDSWISLPVLRNLWHFYEFYIFVIQSDCE